MKELIKIQHTKALNGEYAGSVKANAYSLGLSDTHHCFVLTSTHVDQAFGEQYQKFDIISIDANQRKIYLHEEGKNFNVIEKGLFNMLKNKPEQACSAAIIDHTFPVVFNVGLGLHTILASHALESVYFNIVKLLNAEAVTTMQQLGLPLIPRVYNWLVEGDTSKFGRRIEALKRYPILLVPIVTPVMHSMMHHQFTDDDQDDSLLRADVIIKLSHAIDADHAIEPLLQTTYEMYAPMLEKLKFKHHWQITEQMEPEIYHKLEEELELLRMLQDSLSNPYPYQSFRTLV